MKGESKTSLTGKVNRSTCLWGEERILSAGTGRPDGDQEQKTDVGKENMGTPMSMEE